MKCCYVTLLSTENYLPGVVALARSLKSTGTKIPFLCVCSKDLDEKVVNRLHEQGIATSKLTKSATEGLEILNSTEFSHWEYTFDKLLLWGSYWGEGKQFDKIVFLDSDMMIISNIDFLFEYPDFSACQAGRFLNSDWVRLNSGLMVIKPNEDTLQSLMAQLPLTLKKYVAEGKNVGDQDVINDFMPDWNLRVDLHLPEGLNMFFKHLTLAKASGFSFDAADAEKKIFVIHFIGAKKPWHLRGIKCLLYLLKVILKNRYGLSVFLKYMNLVKL